MRLVICGVVPGILVIHLVLRQMGDRTTMLELARPKRLACRRARPVRMMSSSWCAASRPILDIGMLPAQAFRDVFEDTAVAARRAHHEDLLVNQPDPSSMQSARMLSDTLVSASGPVRR